MQAKQDWTIKSEDKYCLEKVIHVSIRFGLLGCILKMFRFHIVAFSFSNVYSIHSFRAQ